MAPYARHRPFSARPRRAPDMWGWLGASGEAVRHGARIVRLRPALVSVAALILALGVGFPIAMFHFLDSLVAPALSGSYASFTERLVTVPAVNGYPAYVYARARVRTLTMSVAVPVTAHLGHGPDAPPVTLECVSADYLDLLAAKPLLGRAFSRQEDSEGATPVVILGYRTWRALIGSDRGTLGATVRLDGRSYTVIGVMPPDFRGVGGGSGPFGLGLTYDADAWTLAAASPMHCMGVETLQHPGLSLRTVGRLNATFTVTAALQELLSHQATLEDLNRFHVDYLQDAVVPMYGPRNTSPDTLTMHWAGVSAAAVVVTACVTVALLLFLGIVQRRADIAVRVQLGAKRPWLLIQLLTEALVVGLLSAPLAVTAVVSATTFMDSIVPIHSAERLLSPRGLLYVAGIVVGAAMVSGLAPAASGARTPPNCGRVRGVNTTTQRQARVLDTLLTVQVGTALVLVALAGLFVRSALSVSHDVGYDLNHLIVVATPTPRHGVDDPSARARRQVALTAARERVRRLRAVRDTALSSAAPLGFGDWFGFLLYVPQEATSVFARVTEVSPTYFDTVGTRLLRGRPFRTEDRRKPVAIVSARVAHRLWPAGDAIGSCVVTSTGFFGGQCITVVGVGESRRYHFIDATTDEVYVPLSVGSDGRMGAAGVRGGPQSLLVRTHTPAREALGAVAASVQGVLNVPRTERTRLLVRPLSELAAEQTRGLRLAATMCGIFGVLALLLAVMGVYGVTAAALRHRLPEMGIRMAMGATPCHIAWLTVRRGLTVLVAGWCVGGLVMLVGGPVVAATLFGIPPVDLPSFLVASVAMGASVAIGVGVVARTAARTGAAVAGQSA